jgi:MerR family transcriptional regulator, copper efflux regulator
MRIGELALQTGTPVRTIRYYEEIGLLPAASRTSSGYRSFGSEHLRYLRFIRRAKGLGLSLEQIRKIIQTALSGQQPCTRVRETVQQSIEQIDQRIAELQAMREDLIRTLEIAAGSDVPENVTEREICPAIESVSIAHPRPTLDSPVDWRV